jgi:hypothetical protein
MSENKKGVSVHVFLVPIDSYGKLISGNNSSYVNFMDINTMSKLRLGLSSILLHSEFPIEDFGAILIPPPPPRECCFLILSTLV